MLILLFERLSCSANIDLSLVINNITLEKVGVADLTNLATNTSGTILNLVTTLSHTHCQKSLITISREYGLQIWIMQKRHLICTVQQ